MRNTRSALLVISALLFGALLCALIVSRASGQEEQGESEIKDELAARGEDFFNSFKLIKATEVEIEGKRAVAQFFVNSKHAKVAEGGKSARFFVLARVSKTSYMLILVEAHCDTFNFFNRETLIVHEARPVLFKDTKKQIATRGSIAWMTIAEVCGTPV